MASIYARHTDAVNIRLSHVCHTGHIVGVASGEAVVVGASGGFVKYTIIFQFFPET